MTIGIVAGGLLCRQNRWRTHRHDDVHLRADQFGGQLWKPVEIVLRSANLKCDCLTFDVTQCAQRFDKLRPGTRRRRGKKADPCDLRLSPALLSPPEGE